MTRAVGEGLHRAPNAMGEGFSAEWLKSPSIANAKGNPMPNPRRDPATNKFLRKPGSPSATAAATPKAPLEPKPKAKRPVKNRSEWDSFWEQRRVDRDEL